MYAYIWIYDSQIVHTIHYFKPFYPKYFADNQIGKIIENDIFRRVNILSLSKLSLLDLFRDSGSFYNCISYFSVERWN